MTDKKILDEVYRQLCWTTDNFHHMNMDRMFDKILDMKDTIEREWQAQDIKDNPSDFVDPKTYW
jgi:hypothetical protein